MKEKDKTKKNPKPGPVVPAGTEQETGLTRGQTEKPVFNPASARKKRPDDEPRSEL